MLSDKKPTGDTSVTATTPSSSNQTSTGSVVSILTVFATAQKSESNLSPGGIVGVVIGCLIGGGLLAALVVFLFTHPRKPVNANFAPPPSERDWQVGKTQEVAREADVPSGQLKYPANTDGGFSGRLAID